MFNLLKTIFFFLFFPSFSFRNWDKVHLMLLLFMDMNKLLNLYWFLEKQMPILKDMFFSLFFSYFFCFLLSWLFEITYFYFFIVFIFFIYFFHYWRMEQLLFLLLLKEDMNKLFKFYWKKVKQMWILKVRFFFSLPLSLFLKRWNQRESFIFYGWKN